VRLVMLRGSVDVRRCGAGSVAVLARKARVAPKSNAVAPNVLADDRVDRKVRQHVRR
jgi:hypothetical protein